jgi:hypothetical protein
MPAFRSVVSVLVSFVGRSFSTNSRPALRAGNDTTVTGAPASPSSKAVGSYQVSGTSLQLYARTDAPKSYVERA